MQMMVSVVVPNRNKGQSLFHCLAALGRTDYPSFEVIVVDDGSEDDSVAVARSFPCQLITLPVSVGAAEARNIGARQAKGKLLFFLDSDCVVEKDTVGRLAGISTALGPKAIVGGTYTERPYDSGFFSFFQSVFIHYSETRCNSPDYVATHALAMHAEQFRRSGGFARNFLPILEDVDFSHRMRRLGFRLRMAPGLEVAHDFRFGWRRSLRNGFTKARYWFVYSLMNKDLLADSGTASRELKTNLLFFAALVFILVGGRFSALHLFPLAGGLVAVDLLACRRLLRRFFRAGGVWFGLRAAAYFLLAYPFAVWAGAGRGLFDVVTHRLFCFRPAAANWINRKKIRSQPLLEMRK